MKKIIAFVLALLMVLSVAPVAFADDNATNTTVEDPVEEPENETEEPDEPENETEEPEVEDEDENETEEPEVEDEDENETEEPEVEEEEEVEVDENVTEEAGVTPDSALWGLERAIERISLKLTFGKSAKAKKGLAHARERLMEVQAMIAQKKLDKAAKAEEAYEEGMQEVEDNVEDIGDGDAVEELEVQAELEQALSQHRTIIQKTAQLKTKFKGLTAGQMDQISSIVGSLGNSTGKVEVGVKEQKSKTKIKLKAKEGLTDEQIGQITAQIQEAVASGKSAKVVLPGKGKSKVKGGDGAEVESEDEGSEDEAEEPEAEEAKGKGKGKGKDK
jgi:hypothetical protein